MFRIAAEGQRKRRGERDAREAGYGSTHRRVDDSVHTVNMVTWTPDGKRDGASLRDNVMEPLRWNGEHLPCLDRDIIDTQLGRETCRLAFLLCAADKVWIVGLELATRARACASTLVLARVRCIAFPPRENIKVYLALVGTC